MAQAARCLQCNRRMPLQSDKCLCDDCIETLDIGQALTEDADARREWAKMLRELRAQDYDCMDILSSTRRARRMFAVASGF
jgi:hypothetical protein